MKRIFLLKGLDCPNCSAKIEKEVTEKVMHQFVMTPDIVDLYTEGLLACDKTRADLDIYDKKCLEDVNAGHWELWSDDTPEPEDGQALVTLEKRAKYILLLEPIK